MFLGLLRFLAYALAFWFVYRVVIGALRYLSEDSKPKTRSREEQPRKHDQDDPSVYHDVRDARFKDLPNDSSKPS